jgi:ubiquinone/menaquinone biosynthesis C-methylase UbiE
MNTTPDPVPPDFSSLAPFYRWMEMASFGPFLQRSRCAFINALADRRHALILGDGDGRFTARLLRANSQIQIEAVDASLAMLDELRRRANPSAKRVHTTCADARYWQPASPPYDLVVTHFFLDCLTTAEVQSLANKMRAAVAPNAQWLISEFAVPAGWHGKFIARPLIGTLYWAFGWLTGLKVRALPDYRAALRRAGFELLQERRWLGGLLISELWQVNLSAQTARGDIL